MLCAGACTCNSLRSSAIFGKTKNVGRMEQKHHTNAANSMCEKALAWEGEFVACLLCSVFHKVTGNGLTFTKPPFLQFAATTNSPYISGVQCISIKIVQSYSIEVNRQN